MGQILIRNVDDAVLDALRKRAAQKNGDGLQAAKTDAEFAKAMADKLNKENLRKPQNELDKDAFLKLFRKKIKLLHQSYQVILEKIAE